MPLATLQLSTSWGTLTVAGGSRAGEATVIVLPQLRLALDPGRPHRALPRCRTVLASHGHLDHVGGLAYWASQRQLNRLGEGVVLAPRELAPDLERLLGLHARLEGGRPYPVRVRGLADGERVTLRRDLELAAFRTHHWVPTLGATLLWRRRHLRPELRGLPPEAIRAARERGRPVETVDEVALLAYAADTGPGLFRRRPDLLEAEVLLLECTFYREVDRHRAREFGHMHLDDLVALAPRLRCRHLVLLHPSRRHRLRDVLERIEALPLPEGVRLHHLMTDWE